MVGSKSPTHIRAILAQLNFCVSDLKGNERIIQRVIDCAQANDVHLVIFPEMSLPGYPIQDLIFDRDFNEYQKKILENLAQKYP